VNDEAGSPGLGRETAARLVSLNVGKPRPLIYRDKHVPSAIRKSPVRGPLRLGSTGLEGDGQADLENHGGPEKAVCVYPLEHYPYWAERLVREMKPGAFGENFSTEGLSESEVCVGDVYRVGGTVVQVSQPRQPCFKLATRHGVKELALWVQETGLTGFYFRVLEEGEVRAGDGIFLIERPAPGATLAEANRVMHRDKRDLAGIERLLAVSELSASWRRTFEKRLSSQTEDTAPRLEGSPLAGKDPVRAD
jgi:MOSC domain-containing protein YiiM